MTIAAQVRPHPVAHYFAPAHAVWRCRLPISGLPHQSLLRSIGKPYYRSVQSEPNGLQFRRHATPSSSELFFNHYLI